MSIYSTMDVFSSLDPSTLHIFFPEKERTRWLLWVHSHLCSRRGKGQILIVDHDVPSTIPPHSFLLHIRASSSISNNVFTIVIFSCNFWRSRSSCYCKYPSVLAPVSESLHSRGEEMEKLLALSVEFSLLPRFYPWDSWKIESLSLRTCVIVEVPCRRLLGLGSLLQKGSWTIFRHYAPVTFHSKAEADSGQRPSNGFLFLSLFPCVHGCILWSNRPSVVLCSYFTAFFLRSHLIWSGSKNLSD